MSPVDGSVALFVYGVVSHLVKEALDRHQLALTADNRGFLKRLLYRPSDRLPWTRG